MEKTKILPLVLAVFFLALSAMIIAQNDSEGLLDSNEEGVVCAADVRECSDGSFVSRNPDMNCRFNACPDEETENETLLGSSCGTVTPGYQNQCCQQKGFEGWDEENFRCIGEDEEEEENQPLLGSTSNITCEGWNCTKWTACQNGNQTRSCTKITQCPSNESQPRLFKSCNERERLGMANRTFECPEGCECRGATVKCSFENGTRVMTVYAGNSGNTIVQVRDTNVSTNVTLYKENGRVYGLFKDNETKEIKLPDEIRQRFQERARLYNESINLTDEGYYEIEGKKRSRLFWLIPVREKMKAQVDAETGETVKIRNPWWGFLAKDVNEQKNQTE